MDARDRTVVLALLGTDFLARASYGLCRTPLLPLWASSLGASPGEIGLIGGAATLTGLALKFPAGAAADVIGRGPLLLAGLIVCAGAPHLYPVASAIAVLILLRSLHGLTTALYGPASMAVAASISKDRRGELLSWLSNTKIAGSLCGAFLGGIILTESVTGATGAPGNVDPSRFLVAWHVAGALGFAALCLGAFTLVRRNAAGLQAAAFNDATRARSGWAKFVAGMRDTAKNRSLIVVSATEGLQNTSVGILEQFLPIYAVVIAGLTPLHAGILFAVQSASTIVTKPMFGRLSDRRGRGSLLIVGLWVCAASFAFLPWTSSFTLLIAASFVFGIGEALVTATAAALAADVATEAGLGASMGAFGTIGDAGHAAGPLLGGLVLSTMGWSGAESDPHAATAFRACFFLVSLGMAVAAIALQWMSRRRMRSSST